MYNYCALNYHFVVVVDLMMKKVMETRLAFGLSCQMDSTIHHKQLILANIKMVRKQVDGIFLILMEKIMRCKAIINLIVFSG
ncbi:unnamed protein product [Paramecium sonneborni]|uniref:Uncharacterized protein n=1 Tax=Paramecium sonneborni TaxID=65129 RepID=A0A8S1RMZ3_9CILI|nr:unnamed protein product [Paramecium sonneborni]